MSKDQKRRKMHGEVVHSADVIRALGNPKSWAAKERELEFRKHKQDGAEDLDISGIRGYGGNTGYMGYLQKSLEAPLGTNTGLVPAEENERNLEQARSEVQAEIEKYGTRLKLLEKSPSEVEKHVAKMKWWLDYAKSQKPWDPEEESDEEMKALAIESNAKDAENIRALEREIEEYTALLEKLNTTN